MPTRAWPTVYVDNDNTNPRTIGSPVDGRQQPAQFRLSLYSGGACIASADLDTQQVAFNGQSYYAVEYDMEPAPTPGSAYSFTLAELYGVHCGPEGASAPLVVEPPDLDAVSVDEDGGDYTVTLDTSLPTGGTGGELIVKDGSGSPVDSIYFLGPTGTHY